MIMHGKEARKAELMAASTLYSVAIKRFMLEAIANAINKLPKETFTKTEILDILEGAFQEKEDEVL